MLMWLPVQPIGVVRVISQYTFRCHSHKQVIYCAHDYMFPDIFTTHLDVLLWVSMLRYAHEIVVCDARWTL